MHARGASQHRRLPEAADWCHSRATEQATQAAAEFAAMRTCRCLAATLQNDRSIARPCCRILGLLVLAHTAQRLAPACWMSAVDGRQACGRLQGGCFVLLLSNRGVRWSTQPTMHTYNVRIYRCWDRFP